MDTWTFGWTVALLGMGGTMLVLWCLSLVVLLLKKLFPRYVFGKNITYCSEKTLASERSNRPDAPFERKRLPGLALLSE